MRLSASAFARSAGVSLPTVNKWIKSGRISAEKTPQGGYLIDPAELDRVKEHVQSVKGGQTPSITKPETPVNGGANTLETLLELATLRERCDKLAEQLADAKQDKAALSDQLSEAIEQLRAVRLLLPPPSPAATETPTEARRGFWSFLSRKATA